MAFDTISVAIPRYSVRNYLGKLDERGEAYVFDVNTHGPKNTQLQLVREGVQDPLIIHLKDDGTWTAEHVLIIGEKE